MATQASKSKTSTSKTTAAKATAAKSTTSKSTKAKPTPAKTTAAKATTAGATTPKTTAPKPAATVSAVPDVPKPTAAKSAAPAAPTATVSKLEPVVTGPLYRKKELLDSVAAKTGVKRSEVKKVVEATLHEMGLALQDSRDLNLQPFGTVKINRERKLPDGRVMVAKIRMARDLADEEDVAPATIDRSGTKTAAE